MSAGQFARGFRQQVARADLSAFGDLDVRLLWNRVDFQNRSFVVHDDDLGVQFPLVLHDQAAQDTRASVTLLQQRLADLDVLVADNATLPRDDGYVVRIPLGQNLARADLLPLLHAQDRTRRHRVPLDLPLLLVEQNDLTVPVHGEDLPVFVLGRAHVGHADDPPAAREDSRLVRGLNRDAADVERAHRELRARLADGLRGDDADGHALLDELAQRQVHSVALRAHPERSFAREGRADADLGEAELLNSFRHLGGDRFVLPDDHLVRNNVHDVVPRRAAVDGLRERDVDLFALVDDALGDAAQRPAVVRRDDDVLRHVDELPGEIAGVGGLERRVGEALPRAVGGGEVLQHAQPLAEVRKDGRLDDLPGRTRHQAAHGRELAHLVLTSPRPGFDHQVNRVEVFLSAPLVLLQPLEHRIRHELAGVRPLVEDLVVALAVGQRAALIVALDSVHARLGVLNDLPLLLRDAHVVLRERQARARGERKARLFQVVQKGQGLLLPAQFVAELDDVGDAALVEHVIGKRHILRKDLVKDETPDGRLHARVRQGLAVGPGNVRMLPKHADLDEACRWTLPMS